MIYDSCKKGIILFLNRVKNFKSTSINFLIKIQSIKKFILVASEVILASSGEERC